MVAGWVLATAVFVKVLSCMATNEARVIAASTPSAWPVSPYYNYWVNGTQYYNPVILTPTTVLSIAFVNESDRAIEHIEFGVFSGDTLVLKVRDSGRFSPGVTIKHDLRLNAGAFPLPSGELRCVALDAKTALNSAARSHL